VLVAESPWESAALGPAIVRAVSYSELRREHHRLAVTHQRRLLRERDEAEHLLQQQRQILSELEGLPLAGDDFPERADRSETTAATTDLARLPSPVHLPPEVKEYYHELLRTYVIMGSGSLGEEIATLAELISLAGMSPGEAWGLHLERVETLVRGLGNRSTRHVMARADLLALELMLRLCECYYAAGPGQNSPAETPSASGHDDGSQDPLDSVVGHLRERLKVLARDPAA
jgi:hypothetical protein